MTDVPVREGPAPEGDNKPPSDVEILRQRLTDDYPVLLKRVADLEAAIARTPLQVNDDELAGKMADFVRQLQTARKDLEAARTKEKAPLQELADTAYAFFTQPWSRIKTGIATIEQRLTAYQREKEDRLRAEAAEKLRKEQEAARIAKAKADKELADAQEQLRLANEKQRKADKAKADALEAERKAKKAEDDAKVAEANAKTQRAATLRQQAQTQRAKSAAKAVQAQVHTQQSEVAFDRADSSFVASLDSRDGVARHHVAIEGANKIVTASPADLTRTRGDYGSVQSLQRHWTFRVVNPDLVPRHYLKPDDDRINLDIKRSKGGVEIPGIEISESKNVRVS